MSNDDRVWQFVIAMLPTWKGTNKDLFEAAYAFAYDYNRFMSGEQK